MRKPSTPILALLLLLLLGIGGMQTTFANSQESVETIGSVRIEGLKRTKESVIRSLIDIEPGDILNKDTIVEIESTLQKSGIFASVTVAALRDMVTGTTDLVIVIEEKWTLIPIPFFSTDGSDFNGGLFLLESNLFGYNKFLMTAVFGGTDGINGLLIYSDPSIANSLWSGSIVGGFGTSDEKTMKPDGTLIRSFTTNYQNISLGIGYDLTPTTTLKGRIKYRQWVVEGFEAGLDTVAITDNWYMEPSLELAYDNTRLSDVLLVGTTASLSGRYVTLENGWEMSTEISWSYPVVKDHRLRLLASGGWGTMPAIAEFSTSDRDGYRTLPYQATTADKWGSASIAYDLPIFKTSWGTGVISHYWEAGMYDTETIQAQPFLGPGGSFRIYLKKVAIPAMGIDIAYNMIDPSWVFSLTVGMRM